MAIIIAYYIHITYLGQLLVNSGFIKMFYQIAFINANQVGNTIVFFYVD